MDIKAALIDFDGTIVTKDLLDVFCDLAGKQQLCTEINQAFHKGKIDSIEFLIKKINLLQGLSLEDIYKKLRENSYLREGSEELLRFFQEREIKTILNSGQMIPVLQFYQRMLDIDYVIGTQPEIRDGIIYGVSPEHPIEKGFKFKGYKSILDKLGISFEQVVALGDSPTDKKAFEYSALSIAIDPKGGVEKYADYVIRGDLRESMHIINNEIIYT
jgi:HAD superfamily phosphoserine phosphatase-like hydrolase